LALEKMKAERDALNAARKEAAKRLESVRSPFAAMPVSTPAPAVDWLVELLWALQGMRSASLEGRHRLQERVELLMADARDQGHVATVLAQLRHHLTTPQTTNTDPARGRYYIQDTRNCVGNAALWWGPDGGGYTTDIDEAGQFEEGRARSIERNRSTDKPIPVHVALSAASRVVDVSRLRRALNAAAQPSPAGAREPAKPGHVWRYDEQCEEWCQVPVKGGAL
jgi:hypothetical protein